MRKLSPSQKMTVGAVVFVAFLAAVGLGNHFKDTTAYVHLRSAIPVAQSVSEAERLYKITATGSQSIATRLHENAEAVASASEADSSLHQLLATQVGNIDLLASSKKVQSKQADNYKAAVEREFVAWRTRAAEISNSTVRIAEENKIIVAEIELNKQLAKVDRDLEMVELVLAESADIARLSDCLQHALAVGQTTDALRTLTTEIAHSATRLRDKTELILSSWR